MTPARTSAEARSRSDWRAESEVLRTATRSSASTAVSHASVTCSAVWFFVASRSSWAMSTPSVASSLAS